jgi:hypothetical protein
VTLNPTRSSFPRSDRKVAPAFGREAQPSAPKEQREWAMKPDSSFKVNPSDIPTMVDAIFWADPDQPGTIECYASDIGRCCINAVFPGAPINWEPMAYGFFPSGWHGMNVYLPGAATGPNKLLPITTGKPLQDCTPDALACLLAVSVHEQDCRTAMHDNNGGVSIFAPAPQ